MVLILYLEQSERQCPTVVYKISCIDFVNNVLTYTIMRHCHKLTMQQNNKTRDINKTKFV